MGRGRRRLGPDHARARPPLRDGGVRLRAAHERRGVAAPPGGGGGGPAGRRGGGGDRGALGAAGRTVRGAAHPRAGRDRARGGRRAHLLLRAGGVRVGRRGRDPGGAAVAGRPPVLVVLRRPRLPVPRLLRHAALLALGRGAHPARGRGVPDHRPGVGGPDRPVQAAGVRRRVRLRGSGGSGLRPPRGARHGDRPLPRALLPGRHVRRRGGARDDRGARRRGARPPCPLPGAVPAPFRAGPALRADPAGHPSVLPRGGRRDRAGPGLAARPEGRGAAPAPRRNRTGEGTP